MGSPIRLLGPVDINPGAATVMHIDVNSCFATIEQQANPLLRGKPVAVAAYTTPSGCILAPSIEAKALGIKTGMQVWEGRRLCPRLIVLPSDPWKYRYINRKLLRLFQTFAPVVEVKSIDEMNLDFRGTQALQGGLLTVGQEIKAAIREEVGDWMRVSIGVAPNRYLAKLAAMLHKPDGLTQIDASNLRDVLSGLHIIDVPGIKERNRAWLFTAGVYTVPAMLDAPPQRLVAAFRGITGYYWHLRLRGWEIDDVENARRGLGHSYALTTPTADFSEIARLLCKLTEKVGRRMRRAGYAARGIHLDCGYTDGTGWNKRTMSPTPIFATSDLYQRVMALYEQAPPGRPVQTLAVSCYWLVPQPLEQASFFGDEQKKRRLTQALDAINERWGEFTISPARMMVMENTILDRIGFGGVKDLEDLDCEEEITYEPLTA